MPSSSSSSTSATTSERASNSNHSNISSYHPLSYFSLFPAGSPRNLLPLRLDERKDCEFALPFNYECDASANAGKFLSSIDRPSNISLLCFSALDDDDDDSLMRQVLAISQIEYVEALKKQQQPPKSDDPDGPSSSSDAHLL